jgi:hypothetical protein
VLAACRSLAPLAEELRKEEPPKAGPDEPGGPAKIPALTRDTYQTLGLTRDLLILSGSLEARLFQAATVLIAVPVGRRKFATVFHVECSNCSWFYKTNSFAQIVGTADVAPEIDISDLPGFASNG